MSVKDSQEMKETESSTTVKQHDRSETDLWRTKLLRHATWFARGGGHEEMVVAMSPAIDETRWSVKKERCRCARSEAVQWRRDFAIDVNDRLREEPDQNTGGTERVLHEQSVRTRLEERLEVVAMVDASIDAWKASEVTKRAVTVFTMGICTCTAR